jgi:hypothetical protein
MRAVKIAALACVAAILVACGTPPTTPWSVVTKPGQGAVLFGADTHLTNQTPSWDFLGFAVMFYPAGTPTEAAAWVEVSGKNEPSPLDTLFLVNLPAGDYANTQLQAAGPGYSPWIALTGDSFQRFTVRPGEVTVLGKVNATASMLPSGEHQGTFNRKVTTRVDDATKASLVDGALARPEAQRSGWAAPLQAALAKLRPQ